jgi:hypothetical protein
MDMIKQLKERWKGYKEKRFLENYGCKSWREYERKYDDDIGPRARWAHTYYHGYPHVLPIDPQNFIDWVNGGRHPYHELVEKMMEWCEQNCQGKWRNDWHRGFWDHGGNYEFNGISGGDVMFFAFKEESDYVWFKLAWK